MIAVNSDLARRLDALEQKYDGPFCIVFDAIRALMDQRADETKSKTGFRTEAGERE